MLCKYYRVQLNFSTSYPNFFSDMTRLMRYISIFLTKETRDTVFPTEAANFFWITETNSFGYSTVKLESCLEDLSYRCCKYL